MYGAVSGLAMTALARDDEKLAASVGAAVAIGVVGGSIWWTWYRQSHGPPKPRGQPTPAPGSARDVNTQLRDGPGYSVLRPQKAYGQGWVVTRIKDRLASYHTLCPDAPDLKVGNISKLGGGPMAPHKSHQWGTDVDIALPLGADRRWCLVRSFLDDDRVEYIFYDKALIKTAKDVAPAEYHHEFGKPGRLRHWPGHKDHIHVRFHDA